MFYVHLRNNVSNIIYNDIGIAGCHVVYKHYVDKYFVLIVDDVESDVIDLSLLFCIGQSILHCLGSFETETMQVQTQKMNRILDEIICGGIVIQYQSKEVVARVNENDRELRKIKDTGANSPDGSP